MANILVVDDEENDRVGLSSILERAGHTVRAARNGEEALDAFLAERFHLVVTDMVMPGRNGLGLISALRGVDPGTAIIAVSGRSPGQLEASRIFGARAVLTKPIDRTEFLAAVHEIVGVEGEGTT